MEEKITDKEMTWLALKYGPEWATFLAMLRSGARKFCEETFSVLEHKAADYGDVLLKERHEKIVRTMADEMRKEIDAELLKNILGQAGEK